MKKYQEFYIRMKDKYGSDYTLNHTLIRGKKAERIAIICEGEQGEFEIGDTIKIVGKVED